MTHTKGPWQSLGIYEDGYRVFANNIDLVATVPSEANARLIATAPELLEMLEEIVSYAGGANNALEDEYVMARVDEAIQKAKA